MQTCYRYRASGSPVGDGGYAQLLRFIPRDGVEGLWVLGDFIEAEGLCQCHAVEVIYPSRETRDVRRKKAISVNPGSLARRQLVLL